jgi:hypothetical protein
MNDRMDNYNYWNDSRTIAGMVPKEKIEEIKGRKHIVWETEDDDGIEVTHNIVCKWEVCGTCYGEGKHVNPSIDASGLTREDFDREPGFEEAYMSGRYDQPCNECKGRTTVPVIDEHANSKELVAQYQQHRTDLYNDAAESAAERAMGA